MARNDHHAPGSETFDPESYDFVIAVDLDPEDKRERLFYSEVMASIRDRYVTGQGYTWTGDKWNCVHCGQWIRYAAIMKRDESKELVYIGETCLDNRFTDVTAAQFKEMRKRAADLRARQKIKAAVHELCERHPLLTELTYIKSGNPLFTDDRHNGFLCDVAWKFLRKGELSEKQINAVERCIRGAMKYTAILEDRDRKRAAERDELEAKGVRVPDGERVTVTGVVLSVKDSENDWGITYRMTVKSDTGYRINTTVPAAILSETDKGSRVQFDATLNASEDDPMFGFGKRPTKARILS